MKKAILTFGLLLTAIVLTSYVEPTTKNEVKIDKTTLTSDIGGGKGAGGGI
jgi:hypothetical protein